MQIHKLIFASLVFSLSLTISSGFATQPVIKPQERMPGPRFNQVRKGSHEYLRIRKMILMSPKEPALKSDENLMDEILPGLFLGSQKAVAKVNKTHQISHILSCRSHAPKPKVPHVSWKVLEIKDKIDTPLSAYLEKSYKFLDRTKTGALVHCRRGHSRSASIVIAYIMKKYDVPYDAAYRFVRSRRPTTRPNPGFVCQLKNYERTVCH
jgi:predicted protein tyrosine phosphatase